jgi:integrase
MTEETIRESDLKNPAIYPPQKRPHSLGRNLFLYVADSGYRSFTYRYEENGSKRRKRQIKLGELGIISLAQAREKVIEYQRQRNGDRDPAKQREAEKQAAKAEARKGAKKTFRDCAAGWIAKKESGWCAEYANLAIQSLANYAYPILGDLPCDAIDEKLVLKVVEPIWKTKTPTAVNLLKRIEGVIDFAIAGGDATDRPNPARFKGRLEYRLPAPNEVHTKEHRPAMPYADVPAFLTKLASDERSSWRALAFIILTATRTDETVYAKIEEVDFDTRTWTIPAERMKGKKGKRKPHKVPLSDQAFEMIKDTPAGSFLFPGLRDGPLGENTLLRALEGPLGYPELTVHGFRASFRSWIDDETSFPADLAEECLAHRLPIVEHVSAETHDAYARKNLSKREELSRRFARRREIMQAWADYCMPPPAAETTGDNVVALRAAG